MAHTLYGSSFSNNSSANPSNISGVTVDNTVSVIIVGILTAGDTQRTGADPTYNGKTFTLVDKAIATAEGTCELWYLLEPGANTGAISCGNTGTVTVNMGQVSYIAAGDAVSVLDDTTTQDDTTSANPSITVTTTADGDCLAAVLSSGSNQSPSDQSHILLLSRDNGQNISAMQHGTQSSAGSLSATWTLNSDNWAGILVTFKEFTASATGILDFERGIARGCGTGFTRGLS